jgi:hypothetical protein
VKSAVFIYIDTLHNIAWCVGQSESADMREAGVEIRVRGMRGGQ